MTDEEMVILALNCMANRIETGNPDLTANDMRAMGKKVEAIPEESQYRVTRLRQLANNVSQRTDRLMEQFHRLWGLAKEKDYQKKEWIEMQRLLQEDVKGVSV